MLDPIVFEQPLNERTRIFLRLERLFQRIDHHANLDSHWDSQACIRYLVELCELANRGDLKSDVIKELERQHLALKPLMEESGVDHARLQSLLERQQTLQTAICDTDGRMTKRLRSDELVNAIQQRACMPGGGCDFDLPSYHFWLSQPLSERLAKIDHWLEPFDHVREAISLCLEVLRLSARSRTVVAEKGFYEQSLDTRRPPQLLRLILPRDSICYPEVSAGKHRFSIRFFSVPDTCQRPVPCDQDVEFSLSSCGV
ncbi:MAG: cell division protein ZapD [Pseudomonadota bacterium]